MGKFFKDYFRSESFIRYLVTMIASPFAAKYGLDATQTGSLDTWLVAGVMGIVTIAPAIYSQLTSPSKDALKVAIAADQVMQQGSTQVVSTSEDVPDIIVKPATRGNQG